MDPADPAFSHPTKQVGPHYTREVRGGSRAVVISGWAGANSQQSLHATTYLPMSAGSTVRLGRDATTGSPTPPPSVSLSCAARLQEAEAYAREKGWAVAPDGDAFRRVVASPLPRDIVEARAVQVLLQVRCAGDGNAAAAAASALRWGRERGSCCCCCAAAAAARHCCRAEPTSFCLPQPWFLHRQGSWWCAAAGAASQWRWTLAAGSGMALRLW